MSNNRSLTANCCIRGDDGGYDSWGHCWFWCIAQLVNVMVIGAALLITMTISMLIVVLVLRLVVMETVALVDEVLVLMMMAHVLVLCY